MRATRKCPQCQTTLNDDAPDGFCPTCMLEGALRLGSDADPQNVAPGAESKLPRIGDYQLLDEIARGGMGVVYRACQLSLNRLVAVKLILTGQFADQSAVRRFHAEALAAAKLCHPNIVAVHEIGEQSGQRFFSMEYVDGPNLGDFVRQQPISIRQAAQFVKKISEAVHYAHEQGIVHRDLKPSNILIDGLFEPRVTDFGLARDLKSEADLTLTGQVLGSPNYISPEQASGIPACGPATDIYSLGAILYHLLAGRPPFAAETLTATLQQVTTADPISPRILNPSVPRDLETICLKCLEKEPAQRYRSAAELAKELGRFLNDEPIHARPIRAPEKAWRWCRRKPVVAGLITAFSLSLLLGFCGVLWQWQRAEQRAEESRYREYVSDMLRAQNELKSENIGQARQILQKYLPRHGEKDLRNWEWRYAWNESRSDELYSFQAYDDLPAYSVSVDSHGRRLAVGGPEKAILWDILERRELARLSFTNYETVFSIAFSRDEERLFAGTSAGRLLVWNLDTLKTDLVLSNLSHVRSLAVSPNGKLLAIYAHDGLTVWRLESYEQILKFPDTSNNDNLSAGIAFSADSSRLAYAREGGAIVLWNLPDANQLVLFEGHKANVTGLAFSRDESFLISASRDATTRIWQISSGREVERLTVSGAFVSALDVSPDGTLLALGGAGQQIQLFETASWKQSQVLTGHERPVRSIKFCPAGNQLISGGADGTVRFWTVAPKEQRLSTQLPDRMKGAELSEDGEMLFLASTNGASSYWEAESFKAVALKVMPDCGPTRISPGKRFTATATTNGVNLSDNSTGRTLTNLSLRPAGVRELIFSRDGLTIAARADDHICHILRINPQARDGLVVSRVASVPLMTNNIWSLKFSANGKFVGVTYEGVVNDIWDLSSLKKTQLQNVWQQTDIAIPIDGGVAFTSCASGRLRVWDLTSGKEIITLGGQLGSLLGVALSLDETRLAACGGGGAVRIWDRATLQEVAYIKLQARPVHQLVYSPSGETLVARAHGQANPDTLFRLRAPRIH